MKKYLIAGTLIVLTCSLANMHAMQRRRRTRRYAPSSRQALTMHGAIQQQFLNLQRNLGVRVASPTEVTGIRRVRGQQATQAQFNKIRSELNTLLSQKALDADDINLINQKINRLQRLKPARWPRVEDYRQLLRQTQ